MAINLLLRLTILPFFTTSSSPDSPTNRRILILLDDFALNSPHLFFNSRQSRNNFNLDFRLADDPKLSLQR
ncbi:hypothetical protein POPTR_009G112922v4 [Populus trichocarpa]|uniref:Uncharacterized protein n=2 Tax=Populus trichocarpa TaxID=3694 RepID=A0ACC0RGU0_POPTR|nr:hypothetical protein BDE02_09G099200 [Populus trichocarpa]KAI9215536.1 hypothetical protein POPTR_T125804v4 [Populus trichocarpa]PNT20800.1 hypothetical protein POPTR_009G112922v4 [Populus trichocarpa]